MAVPLGTVRHSVAQCHMELHGTAQPGTALHGVELHETTLHGTAPHGTAWHCTAPCGTIQCPCAGTRQARPGRSFPAEVWDGAPVLQPPTKFPPDSHSLWQQKSKESPPSATLQAAESSTWLPHWENPFPPPFTPPARDSSVRGCQQCSHLLCCECSSLRRGFHRVPHCVTTNGDHIPHLPPKPSSSQRDTTLVGLSALPHRTILGSAQCCSVLTKTSMRSHRQLQPKPKSSPMGSSLQNQGTACSPHPNSPRAPPGAAAHLPPPSEL